MFQSKVGCLYQNKRTTGLNTRRLLTGIHIREISKEYQLRNIYNEDESGLLFRMGPSRTYLAHDELRSAVHGTDFQKYKQRITVVFCVNADGCHKLPIRYIGSSHKPLRFRDHASVRGSYYQHDKAWMDGNKFQQWIHWWYNEVKKVSHGPWLLILDNCRGTRNY
eukprot:IDg1982t1